MDDDPLHHLEGDLTGNPNQSKGKHLDGIFRMALGDKDRAKYENNNISVVDDWMEERDSDPNIRRI
jgi:hypothetical protein